MSEDKKYIGEGFNELSVKDMQFITGADGAQVQPTPTIVVSFVSGVTLSIQITKG